jgi:hypothetical protein
MKGIHFYRLLAFFFVLGTLSTIVGCTQSPSERRQAAEKAIIPIAVQSIVDSYYEGVHFIVETETDLASLTEIENLNLIKYTLYPDAIKDMKQVNISRIPLSDIYQIPYETLPFADYEALRAKGDWDAFFARYGRSPAYIMISRVGFNEKVTEATIYIGVRCGSMCGQGTVIYFLKTKGTWAVVDTQIVWMS